MESNVIVTNAVINGIAIIDHEFEIITANEDLYKFIGISKAYSIVDIIHQVDLDDFIDVVNSLRMNQEKSMVIRMKNIDNSYRWVLLSLKREENSNKLSDEYVVIRISDIMAMKQQNDIFRNTISNFRHIMAMENELFFTYEYAADVFTISSFIDNEIYNRYTASLKETQQFFIDHNYIPEESRKEFEGFFNDICKGAVSYTRRFQTNTIAQNTAGFTNVEIQGATIYENMIPARGVGSLKNLNDTENIYSQNTYQFNNTKKLLPFKDMLYYIRNNLALNKYCELAVIQMSIDHLDDIRTGYGKQVANDIYQITIQTMKKIIAYRGVASEKHYNMFGIVIKDINTEVNLRSFLEHLRTRITWECQKKYSQLNVTLTLGIVRFPENSMNWKILEKKLSFAYRRSKNKGGNNYVIFREHLHGDITLNEEK